MLAPAVPPCAWAPPRSPPSRRWTVLPAAAALSAAAAARPGVAGLGGGARRRGQRAVGFEVQEASAEEQEEYDQEKAAEAAEEAERRAADPKGPDEMALARLRIWAKSQRTHKVNPGIAVQKGQLVASMPMEAGTPLVGVLPGGCLPAAAKDREAAALQLAWKTLEEAGVVPRIASEALGMSAPWPQEYLRALPQRPAQPLLWPVSEVSELQDTSLQCRLQELGGRVDQWLEDRCRQLSLRPEPLLFQFRAAFVTCYQRAIALEDTWILAPFLDAVEPMGINSEGKGKSEGNCKVEVEDIGGGQQLVVLSATKDLNEGDVLTQELEPGLSCSDVLLSYGRVLPESFVETLEVKAYVDSAPPRLEQLPGARPGRLPGDVLLLGQLKPWQRYAGDDGTRMDDLKAMIDDSFLSAALIMAKEQADVEEFVNLTGRRKVRCLEELLKLLRSSRGEFPSSLKEDKKQLAKAKGCRYLAVRYRISFKRALRAVIEEVKEALERAEDGGGLPFALGGRK